MITAKVGIYVILNADTRPSRSHVMLITRGKNIRRLTHLAYENKTNALEKHYK